MEATITITRAEYEALKASRDAASYISGVLEAKYTDINGMVIQLDLIGKKIAQAMKARSA